MVPLDIKKLTPFQRPGHRITGDRSQDSPGTGWEYSHVAVDDASRVSLRSPNPMSASRPPNNSYEKPWPSPAVRAFAASIGS